MFCFFFTFAESFMEINIQTYRNLFSKKLPGSNAHFKMMPQGRVFENTNNNSIQSAVNIVTYLKNEKLFFLLTKRKESLTHHSGQISLPGGRKEKYDSSLWATAQRETFEEIGINTFENTYLGKLTPLYIDVSNFIVHPFVSFCSSEPKLKANDAEVKKIFEVSFDVFFNSENIFSSSKFVNKKKINYPFYSLENEQVWGATAMILYEFYWIFKKLYTF